MIWGSFLSLVDQTDQISGTEMITMRRPRRLEKWSPGWRNFTDGLAIEAKPYEQDQAFAIRPVRRVSYLA
jgi:hypothetical protein